jgi:hypothetical protein
MNSKTLFSVLVVVLVLLGGGILAAAYEASNLLEKRSAMLAGLKATDQAETAKKAQLVKNKKDIVTYAELNQIAKTVVPQDKDQAEAVREIVNLAGKSGISKLSSISFPPSTLGGAKVRTAHGLTQLTAVKGIPGVYNLQITVTQADSDPVPYSSFTDFLSRLEQNRRTAQVSSITVQPNPKSPNLVSFTLVVNEFIKP